MTNCCFLSDGCFQKRRMSGELDKQVCRRCDLHTTSTEERAKYFSRGFYSGLGKQERWIELNKSNFDRNVRVAVPHGDR